LAALFGGILAQEITKQTGKYMPMQQVPSLSKAFLYHDSIVTPHITTHYIASHRNSKSAQTATTNIVVPLRRDGVA
jgi:hypothetical protein